MAANDSPTDKPQEIHRVRIGLNVLVQVAIVLVGGLPTIANWIAATVRPGMPRSQAASTTRLSNSTGTRTPKPAPAGSACTIE